MRRAAARSVASCATWNWMPWNSAMALPNCFRSLIYPTAASSAPWATPSICAPMPILPSLRVSIAILYPCPTGPMTFWSGTWQPSRISSQVLDARMPSLFSFLPTENPGKSRSTRNAVIPLYPMEGSMLAKMMKKPASAPLVIQSLRPVSSQPVAVFVARASSANASLPLLGSESANAPSRSAVSRGK